MVMNQDWFKEHALYWCLRVVNLILSYCSKVHVSISGIQRPACLLCARDQSHRKYFSHWGQIHGTSFGLPWRVCCCFPPLLQNVTATRHGVNTGMFTRQSLEEVSKMSAYRSLEKSGGECGKKKKLEKSCKNSFLAVSRLQKCRSRCNW